MGCLDEVERVGGGGDGTIECNMKGASEDDEMAGTGIMGAGADVKFGDIDADVETDVAVDVPADVSDEMLEVDVGVEVGFIPFGSYMIIHSPSLISYSNVHPNGNGERDDEKVSNGGSRETGRGRI